MSPANTATTAITRRRRIDPPGSDGDGDKTILVDQKVVETRCPVGARGSWPDDKGGAAVIDVDAVAGRRPSARRSVLARPGRSGRLGRRPRAAFGSRIRGGWAGPAAAWRR